MEFLYFLQSIRNPVLDFLFDIVTKLGEETVFLAIAICFFWCVSKREGYYILITGLFGTVINQGLKIACRVERPWNLDPNFEIVESARAEAGGYSFPSGHTQNIAGTFGAIGKYSDRRRVKLLTLAIIVLVALSRMYLGVHTPKDVIFSLGLAAFLVLILHPFFREERLFHRAMPWFVAISIAISLSLVIYVNALPDTVAAESELIAESYIENLGEARKNAATLFGCMLGLVLVYPLDRFVVKFETDALWYAQVLKVVLGLCSVLLLKAVLPAPITAFFELFLADGTYTARGVTYFIIVAFAGVIWPLTFKYFAKLRIPFMDRFTVFLKNKFTRKVDTESV